MRHKSVPLLIKSADDQSGVKVHVSVCRSDSTDTGRILRTAVWVSVTSENR